MKFWRNIVRTKVIPTFLLVSLFSLQIFQLVFIADFIINQNYYAQYECVQKETPNNCCQGSCVLEKEIVLVHRTNDENTFLPLDSQELFFEDPVEFIFDFQVAEAPVDYYSDHGSTIFIRVPNPPPDYRIFTFA